MQKHISSIFILVVASAAACYGQSVADAARQERQKETTKDSATAPKVITNDDLAPASPDQASAQGKTSNPKAPKSEQQTAVFAKNAEKTKAAILTEKIKIKNLQIQIDKERASIRYVEVGVPSNENQLKKQQVADRMQEQLDEETKQLAAMQEAARQAGFGSVVYEP